MNYILILTKYLSSIFITVVLGLVIYYLVNIGNKYIKEDKEISLNRKLIIKLVMLGTLLVVFYYIFRQQNILNQILKLVFYSILLSYLLNPLVNIIEKKGISRGIGVVLIYVILIGIVILLSFSLIPKLSNEIQSLVKILPDQFNKIYSFFNRFYVKYSNQLESLPSSFDGIRDALTEGLDVIQLYLINTLKGFTSSILKSFSKVVSFVICPILAFYFLKDKEYFKKKIYLLLPKTYRNDILKISREIDSSLNKFIRGQLIVAAIVGGFTTIGLLIVGIDFAIIIGIIAGVADIIPYFGPIIGILPALIFALLESPVKAIWVIVVFVVIQQLEGNIISPKIVGESVGLHPVVVMISLLIGGGYFGVLGMLLAVPVTSILKITSGFIIEKLSKL